MPASDAMSPIRAREMPSRANTRRAARRISCSRRLLRSCFRSPFSAAHLATRVEMNSRQSLSTSTVTARVRRALLAKRATVLGFSIVQLLVIKKDPLGGGARSISAAGNVQDLSADIRSPLGSQEGDAVRNILDGSKARDRRRSLGILAHFLEMAQPAYRRRVDDPGSDGVHRNPMLAAFQRQRAGEPQQSGLRRRVVHLTRITKVRPR